MQIIHKIDDFLFTIFPGLIRGGGGGNSLIINELENYYTFGPFKPKVTIEGEWVKIAVDTTTIISQEADYKKTVALCEKGKYPEAKIILKKLIEKNPTNSEYHRIMGQILSDEGDQEEAINCLIDSLRWDSQNGWALLMMGNIFAKFKSDVPTAMKYYDQALAANVQDHISLTNIGYLLLQQGQFDDAEKFLWQAVKINAQYANTQLALALIAQKKNDLHSAFFSTVQAIKLSSTKEVIYEKAVQQAFEISNTIIATDEGKKIMHSYRHRLEQDGGTVINIIKDEAIKTAAKIEFAEIYNTPEHNIKYKPGYPAVEHLVMHELVHLDFVVAARKEKLNQLFIASQQHKTAFTKELDATRKLLQKMAVQPDTIEQYCAGVFDGINLQAYNTPIDLLIEDFLYHEFVELRPYQFLSLHTLTLQNIKAVTDKKVVDVSPKNILSKSKIYSITHALQLKALFGLDVVNDFKPTAAELKQATGFYNEYLQYKEDKEPAEEYELVQHWADDLQLNNYFELVDEITFTTKRNDIDNLLNSIEQDPYDLQSANPFKERQMKKFQQTQVQTGTNMSVVMYMVEALQYFDNMPPAQIKKIATDIAFKGTEGFAPNKKDYQIESIPNKTFTGYQILAWYYTSWALAMPEMADKLGLNYAAEYTMALTMKTNN